MCTAALQWWGKLRPKTAADGTLRRDCPQCAQDFIPFVDFDPVQKLSQDLIGIQFGEQLVELADIGSIANPPIHFRGKAIDDKRVDDLFGAQRVFQDEPKIGTLERGQIR